MALTKHSRSSIKLFDRKKINHSCIRQRIISSENINFELETWKDVLVIRSRRNVKIAQQNNNIYLLIFSIILLH